MNLLSEGYVVWCGNILTKKIYILGVGCQKGGTTWLHNYLSLNPHINMGFNKEYHFFDALYLPECSHFLDTNRNISPHAKYLLDVASRFENVRHYIPPLSRIINTFKYKSFYGNIDSYFDYFVRLLNKRGVSVTGDFTPSYAGLPVSVFEMIKESFERRGVLVKVVFIMRDPVSRCISAMRMARRDGLELKSNSESQSLLSLYRTPNYEFRTRYENTIDNIERVFSLQSIYYGFYENMFSEESLRRLSIFLSIPYIRCDYQNRVNSSRTLVKIDENAKREVFAFYKNTYDFVAERFGEEFISSIWVNYNKFRRHDVLLDG